MEEAIRIEITKDINLLIQDNGDGTTYRAALIPSSKDVKSDDLASWCRDINQYLSYFREYGFDRWIEIGGGIMLIESQRKISINVLRTFDPSLYKIRIPFYVSPYTIMNIARML